jgi:tRNA threonylcarbamoyladenosine biosynthesis protein TsaE
MTTSRPEARGQRSDERPEARGERPKAGGDDRSDRETIHDSRFTIHELRAWGEALGRSLKPGAIIALQGDLGTGKTTLAQAICRGVGIREDVTSPTFALVNEYHVNGGSVFHLDLYRLAGPADLTNLAWDDIVNSGQIVIIEWPERAGDRLPDEAMRIRLDYVPGDDDYRLLTVD